MIAELRDEACTQWASKWLASQHRASQAFPGLDFNIQLANEEVEEFSSEAEVDDLRAPSKASFSASPAGAPPFDPFTYVSQGPTSGT